MDAAGDVSLTFERFEASMFELTDQWTTTVEAEEYVGFAPWCACSSWKRVIVHVECLATRHLPSFVRHMHASGTLHS